MVLDDLPKLAIHYRTYLFNSMLGNESVKEDHFAEVPKTVDKHI